MKMPFGVHKGKEIATLPKPYLRWLSGRSNLYGQFKLEVEFALTGNRPQSIDDILDSIPDVGTYRNDK